MHFEELLSELTCAYANSHYPESVILSMFTVLRADVECWYVHRSIPV